MFTSLIVQIKLKNDTAKETSNIRFTSLIVQIKLIIVAGISRQLFMFTSLIVQIKPTKQFAKGVYRLTFTSLIVQIKHLTIILVIFLITCLHPS